MDPVVETFRQSLLEDAACLHRFKAHHIDGQVRPATEYTVRGQDMHAMHSLYVNHLCRFQIDSDYEAAERISADPKWSREAVAIFRAWYPGQFFAPERLFGTELKMMVNADGKPTLNPKNARYVGTIDRLEISDTHADVVDGKTHFSIFEPTTIQSVLYSWLTAKSFPFLKTISFHLDFWRWGARRSRDFIVQELDDRFAEEVQPWIGRIQDAEATQEWPPMPNWACSVCTITCPLIESGVSRQAIGKIDSPETATRLTEELYAVQQSQARLRRALEVYVSHNGPVVVGDSIELNYRKRLRTDYKAVKVFQLNEAYGFEPLRGLRVDLQAVRKIGKQYPEYMESLKSSAKDASTTAFGFSDAAEEEEK